MTMTICIDFGTPNARFDRFLEGWRRQVRTCNRKCGEVFRSNDASRYGEMFHDP